MLSGARTALANDPVPARTNVEIVSASEDCGGATLHTTQERGFSVEFPDLAAETSETMLRVRKFCYVQIKVTVPANVRVLRNAFEVSGSATIAPGASGSNVSVRYFGQGDVGSDYYRAFEPEFGAGDFTGASEGAARWSTCRREVRLSLIVDVTARSVAGYPTRTSSVKVKEIKVMGPLHEPCLRPSLPGE